MTIGEKLMYAKEEGRRIGLVIGRMEALTELLGKGIITKDVAKENLYDFIMDNVFEDWL